MHYALFFFLFVLASAFLFRGFGWLTSEFFYYKISYICYLILPISVIIFVEHAVKRQVNRVTKLTLTLCGFGLLFNLLHTGDDYIGGWRILYISYIAFSIFMLTAISMLELKNVRCKNERSILIAIATSSFLSLVFVVFDLLSHYVIDLNFRFSSFSVLIFVYFLSSILYSNGSYSFTSYLNKITQFICMSTLISVLGQFILMSEQVSQLIDLGVLSFNIILSVFILNKVGFFGFGKKRADILTKLISLNKEDSLSMLKDFTQWDEVIKVKVLSEKYLDDNHLNYIFDKKELITGFESVLTKSSIVKLLKNNNSEEEKNYLEALDYILKVTDTEFIILLEQRSEVLTASFSYMMDANYFEDVLVYLGRELELQYREEQYV